jgi:putative acetyltransferase
MILRAQIRKDNPMDIEIRNETAADVRAIEAVTIAAFLNAPHTSHTEQSIVDALRKAGKLTISLVADAKGTVVGHVAVSPVSISDGATGWYGLGPISVAPEYQRRGVGSHLMREALRVLREQGAAGCVLLGEPAYYSRFGFQVDPNLSLPGVPPEYFQAASFEAARPRGIVSYHAAFNVPGDSSPLPTLDRADAKLRSG